MHELVESPGLACRPGRPWHLPTVVFGAVPATLLAFPAALAILFGLVFFLTLEPIAFLMLLGGVLGWAGMIALWSAAINSGVVGRRTAMGLAAGIAGILIFYWLTFFSKDMDPSRWSKMAVIALGPLLYSMSHLWGFWLHPRPAERQAGGGPPPIPGQATAMGRIATLSARPCDEERMRRILVLLLVIPAILELIFMPSILKEAHGMGLVYYASLLFPFYLGIAVTAAWGFFRSRALRGLAVAALLTPILLPCLLRLMTNWLGYERTTFIACVTAVVLPVLTILVMPKRVVRYVPQFILNGRGFNRWWTGLQVAMLITWALLAISLTGIFAADAKSLWFGTLLFWHIGASIVVALTTLALAYVGRGTQTFPRIAQVVFSILLLLIAVPALLGLAYLFMLAGVG